MWELRDRQPHGEKELKDRLLISINLLWGKKKLPEDLGNAHERIAAELDRLVSQGNCERSQDHGIQTIRLGQMIKTYQSGVEALVSLEQEASSYMGRYRSKGGWHSVAKLLPPRIVKNQRSSVARRYGIVVLQAIVNRLKAEGCQCRTTETGEDLFFAPIDSTIPADSASQDSDVLERDIIRPTVADSPVEQIAAQTVTADEVAGSIAPPPQDETQPCEKSASRDNTESLSAATDGEKPHQTHDNGQDAPAEGGDTQPDAEQDVDIRLNAGFRPQGASHEIKDIEIEKIDDLGDEQDHPLSDVEGLSESIDRLGLLELPAVRPNPMEDRYRPVFGRRRLRDCKKKGWEKIPCIVLRVDDRTAELAAIDENLVRAELTVLERAESLRRRKQIYEELHPQAVRPKGGRPRKNAATVAPFSEDAAHRTGASPRKVQLDLEIADKLTDPTKKVLRSTEFANKTTILSKLAKLEPRDQLSAAKLLAKGQAKSVEAATGILKDRKRSKTGGADDAEAGTSTPAERPDGGVERPSFEILVGECQSVLPTQPLGKFRLIFADPPQNAAVDYGDGSSADELSESEYLARVKSWLEACVPLLTEDGSLWLLTRDNFVHDVRNLLIQVGLHPRSWIKIYEPSGEGSVQGFRSSTLHLLHSTKSADQFVFHSEDLDQPVSRSAAEAKALTALVCKPTDDVWIFPMLKAADTERIPSFPEQRRKALLQPVIRCATAAGDWILDPFSGSATTGLVALEEGRNYVGIEKNVQFAEQSRCRLVMAPRGEPEAE
jgi:site-specific DNA-methyltransferase (adenine-specific)